jgi:hypothetical protein
MIPELIERIARDTAHLDNKAAWQEIQARLAAAGVARGQRSGMRDSIWYERRRRDATAKAPGLKKSVAAPAMDMRPDA